MYEGLGPHRADCVLDCGGVLVRPSACCEVIMAVDEDVEDDIVDEVDYLK